MKCFFHSADLDGRCAGAIAKLKFPECEMFGIDYGDEFPFEKITPGEVVYLVDFYLTPFDLMEKLASICHLIWIDHHVSSMEEANEREFCPDGMTVLGKSACELTWLYLFNDESMPLAVWLLGRYDVWDHRDPRILPFQYRLQIENTDPGTETGMRTWTELFAQTEESPLIRRFIQEGELLLHYEVVESRRYAGTYAIETTLEIPASTGAGAGTQRYRAIALNRGFFSSIMMESVYDPARHDIMIGFCRRGNRTWEISLRSEKDEVDCTKIAKHFGGGGHKGSAGFLCSELPFEI